MATPDYKLVEGLLRDALDDVRNATILMTRGETGPAVAEALVGAAECLRELEDLFDQDALAAHAGGRIFTEVMRERVEAMIALSRAASGTFLSAESVAALTRTPGAPRKPRPRD